MFFLKKGCLSLVLVSCGWLFLKKGMGQVWVAVGWNLREMCIKSEKLQQNVTFFLAPAPALAPPAAATATATAPTAGTVPAPAAAAAAAAATNRLLTGLAFVPTFLRFLTGFPREFPRGFPTGFSTGFPTGFPRGFPKGFPTRFLTGFPTTGCPTDDIKD